MGTAIWLGGALLCAAPYLWLVRLCALWLGLALVMALPYLWGFALCAGARDDDPRRRGGSTYPGPERPVSRRT